MSIWGSYVNKKDNTIIWFIKGDTVDAIAKYNPETDEITPLLVDKEEVGVDRFLKFNINYLITGINVIDDLLFWTDNLNEPRQLNINRHYSPNFTSTTLFKDGSTVSPVLFSLPELTWPISIKTHFTPIAFATSLS